MKIVLFFLVMLISFSACTVTVEGDGVHSRSSSSERTFTRTSESDDMPLLAKDEVEAYRVQAYELLDSFGAKDVVEAAVRESLSELDFFAWSMGDVKITGSERVDREIYLYAFTLSTVGNQRELSITLGRKTKKIVLSY